jgi:hypothetical protein
LPNRALAEDDPRRQGFVDEWLHDRLYLAVKLFGS